MFTKIEDVTKQLSYCNLKDGLLSSGDSNAWDSSMSEMGKLGARLLGIILGGAYVFSANSATAQITPDRTLPNNSNVTINGNVINITGGTQAGRNLFHSFQQFSVPTGSTAFFNNAADIQNIFGRVTGGNVSNIDGLIRANGAANLFLINPSGIIFGSNASLNVGGSFVATTANAIQFGDRGFFSATSPEAPSPLLTINPSALLFNQIATAPIKNNSVADAGLNPSSEFTATGLRVPDGRSLLLVGGDINMNGGGLYAFGGRVELGGLRSAGTVGLNGDGNNLSLSFPNSVERSDVFLSNGAFVNVIAGNGGSIAVNARNLEMTSGSFLFAGIESGLGSDNSQAGNISINATGAINLNNKSKIANQVGSQARGQGGDVSISANILRLEGGAQVSTGTFSAGKGGSLTINTQRLLVGDGAGVSVQSVGTGIAGNLKVQANSIILDDRGKLTTKTMSGQGGNIILLIQELSLLRRNSEISTTTTSSSGASGDSGNIIIAFSFIVGVPSENSDIRTNGFKGRGGNVLIVSQGLYGFPYLENLALSLSSINASSIKLVATPRPVASGCTAFDSGGSSFTITGRGGLPPSPDEPLTSDAVWLDTRLPVATAQHQYKIHASKPKPQPIAIVPATGWVFNDKGEVTLISSVTNTSTLNTPISCPAR